MENKFDDRSVLVPNQTSKEFETALNDLCFWSVTESELQMLECSLKAIVGKHVADRMVELRTGIHPNSKTTIRPTGSTIIPPEPTPYSEDEIE